HLFEELIFQTGRDQNTVRGILRWIRCMDTGCRGHPRRPARSGLNPQTAPNGIASNSFKLVAIDSPPSQIQTTAASALNSASTCRHAPHGVTGFAVGV